MAEQTFLQEGGVTVTSARFITEGQTFALNNITSVEQRISDFDWKGPLVLIVIGILVLLFGDALETIAFGILLVIGGIFWWIKGKDDYLIIFHTSGGEQTGLESTDKNFIARVIRALNDAIATKG